MAEKIIHRRAFGLLQDTPGFPNLKILDLSCGDARLLSELAELGCDCTGTRFREDDYILKGATVHPAVKLVNGVDLAQRLPFSDGEFDVVVMTEVLEHLPCHSSIISELGRVAKAKGTLILTTPNIHRLHSRMNFLLAGAHKLKRHRVGWNLTSEDMYAYHYNPVDFPIIHTMLFQAGFRIEKLLFTKTKPKYFFLAVLYPLILLACLLEFRKGGQRASSSIEGERDLRFWMTHPAMLFSEQLFIAGRKFSS